MLAFKTLFAVILLTCGLGITLLAQETPVPQAAQRNTIAVGFGFFNEIFGLEKASEVFANGGTTVWAHGGRMLKSGYYVNVTIAYANRNYNLEERWGIFEGVNNNEFYGLWGVGLSKPFNVRGQHFIEPSLGVLYRQWWRLSPDFWYENEVPYFRLTSGVWHDLGLQFSVSYQYQFSNGFYMGAMAGSFYIWAIGIEGLTLSPVFGVRF